MPTSKDLPHSPVRALAFLLSALAACAAPASDVPPPRAIPARPVRAPIAVARAPTHVAPNATCGELVLRNAELAAEGKGERHPDVVATRDAIAQRCSGDGAGASLLDACRAGRLRELDMLTSRGLNHPAVRALHEALRVCPPETTVASPPTAAECAALRERQLALKAAGKGADHPDVIAARVRLEQCAP